MVRQRRDRGQGVIGSIFGVLSQGSPATSLPADPVSSTPIAATSTGSAFRAAKAPFPSHRAAPCAAGVSDEQESGTTARSRTDRECRQAVAGCGRPSGSPPGSARVTASPAEQDSELCTMADFSRRVPLDELRGRGLMKGLQPEVLEKISRWPSAHAHGDEACTQLIAYMDGSACMTRAWPRLAAEAGWGAVIFAVDASGVWKLAGGTWGPVETDPAAQLFLGASRPTSPVAEVTAIASVLRMLRAARVSIPLTILSRIHSSRWELFWARSRPFGDTYGPAGTERGAMLQATWWY